MNDLYNVQYEDPNQGVSPHMEGVDRIRFIRSFYTIQGEGWYAGEPAVFVRLGGCNRGEKSRMGCAFCDTDFRVSQSKLLSFEEIGEVMKYGLSVDVFTGGRKRPLVVITGGEPMIQNSLVPFIKFLKTEGWNNIQIESNGDRLAEGFKNNRYCDDVHLTVSPKFATTRMNNISEVVLERVDSLKLLVEARLTSPYNIIPSQALYFPRSRVFLSPITVYKRRVEAGEIANAWDPDMVDQYLTQRNYDYAASLATRHGFRLSMQQHLFFNLP